MSKICPACYLKLSWLIEYVGYLYQILICKNILKCNAFFVSILILKNLILIHSEFYSGAVTKRYQCTQKDVQKIVGNSLPNALSRVRGSEKNRQAAEKESYAGEIELGNEGCNED